MVSLIRCVLITVLVVLPISSQADSNTSPDKVRFASTKWCPYICDDKKQPGFIVEYMTELLAQHNTQLEVDVLPWSRAIALARQGKYDGLLTAVASEAPDFHLTSQPSGSYQVCLYKKLGRDIKYEDRRSFQNRTLGGIKNYGYGDPIDSLISNPQQNEKAYLISHNRPLEALIQMTDRDRIDFFAEDSAVIGQFIRNNPKLHLVESAGCIDKVAFYTAVSPNHPNKDRLLSLLDRLLGSALNKSIYEAARNKYSN